MHPPFFFVLAKKNAPCTVEEKAVSSKLACTGKFGDADGCWPRPDKTRRVSSRCAETLLSNYAYAANCDVAFHSRVLVKAPCFSSRCRSRGWIPKEGAAAPSFWSFRKGVQGETQPKGFPPGLSLGATRFSRREKWVASAHLPRGVPPKERRAAPPAAPSFKTAPPGPAARRRRWCAAAGRSRSTAGRRWPFSG